MADSQRLQDRLREHQQVILALDGLQPDVGHEVLWVLRDCCSGEVLVARSLLGATENDLVPLLVEAARICRELDIPMKGVITDGQRSIRNAVASALPGIPHQLCQFHYLREAAKPIAAADLHAKKERQASKFVGCAQLSARWKNVRMTRPKPSVAIAWQSGVR